MPAGQPRIFKTPKAMQKAIDAYFAEQLEREKPPTIMGLVIALGFMSRQSLVDYGGYGKEYSDIITRARQKVQASYEELLLTRDSSRGAQFALSAGFGWTEQTKQMTEDITQDRPDTAEAEAVADEVGRTINLRKAKAG